MQVSSGSVTQAKKECQHPSGPEETERVDIVGGKHPSPEQNSYTLSLAQEQEWIIQLMAVEGEALYQASEVIFTASCRGCCEGGVSATEDHREVSQALGGATDQIRRANRRVRQSAYLSTVIRICDPLVRICDPLQLTLLPCHRLEGLCERVMVEHQCLYHQVVNPHGSLMQTSARRLPRPCSNPHAE